ncbi:MAG TPA: M48 family metalloprotease [Candidatus Acidoferrales bacterium]|nr:M48 family metalloprotease [Candidatus Acidoferrales bacterium]
MRRRALVIALILMLLCAYTPAHPSYATSTGGEIQAGQQSDRQVQDTYTIIKDPLENAWVNDVAKKLWAQVARKDLPYSIKVLDAGDVNAFTTIGGFIYVNEGTLDFVQSDDELAAVIGHETGHNERRHAVMFQNKTTIANVLFGIGSLFSPWIYEFGQFAEAGLFAKWSRQDESEADAYGVLLMTRAGYDPYAAVTFMQHLNATHQEGNSLIDRYFADHPAAPERVKALLANPDVNFQKRSNDQLLVTALHNQNEGRYSMAAIEFAQILKRDPNNAQAELGMGDMQLALGESTKSEQTLAQVAALGNEQATQLASTHLLALRDSVKKTDLLKANLQPLKDQFASAQADEARTVTLLEARRKGAQAQIKALNSRIEAIAYGLPYGIWQVQPKLHSRLEVVMKNLYAMARSINTTLDKTSTTVAEIGTLEKKKESGIVNDNASIFDEMGAPLKLDQPPPQSLALFPSYPKLLSDMAVQDGETIRAADAARGSLALLDVGLGKVDQFFKYLSHLHGDGMGDISEYEFKALTPAMNDAVNAMSNAAVAASQSEQLIDMARAQQLQTRITLLGLGFPSERYETLRRALAVRFPGEELSYDELVQYDLTPGESVAATIVAAGTDSTPQTIVKEAKAENRSIIEVANARGMRAKSLEIFLGLTYMDYKDDPVAEASTHPV